ncbi:protein CYCLOPS isoform X2 [Elaeis guineensis]|uniref:Protein CYCLOPS isoform X3 n=1 Tax=Elaeis guineensis var. tenera TaxID=51953 RepID=A0A6J0PS23_ELAGV|nr:protein CYCLOPS isoform X3 [Elaeis guineensis]
MAAVTQIPGYNSTSIAHRTRQASRSCRISTELGVLSSQQNGVAVQKKTSNDNSSQQNLSKPDELLNDLSQHSFRNAAEQQTQADNLYLAKAWFHSSQPMTRSRSSELRRRYAAMQNMQMPTVAETPNNAAGQGTDRMKQEFTSTSNFCGISVDEMSNQLLNFMSPSNSSTSPLDTPPKATVDTVSSVVSMLKGTLERKKLGNPANKENLEGSSFGFYSAQQVPANLSSNQDAANQVLGQSSTFQLVSSVQMQGSGNLPIAERSIELSMEGFITQPNQIQMGTMSQEPSQSGSSAAAPTLSTGFDVCDGPAHSGQTISVCESSRKHVGNGTPDHGIKAKENGERIFDNNIKDERKRGSLVQMGSVSSVGSVDKGDPTKRRRVERSRKMAEAKERNSAPTLPSDMQAVLKRCENLEKEVRSLKLNLSFMNRKDSEQTKQIEELQKQNEDLTEEKERLLEEIERIAGRI